MWSGKNGKKEFKVKATMICTQGKTRVFTAVLLRLQVAEAHSSVSRIKRPYWF